jgi:hypothetical protein
MTGDERQSATLGTQPGVIRDASGTRRAGDVARRSLDRRGSNPRMTSLIPTAAAGVFRIPQSNARTGGSFDIHQSVFKNLVFRIAEV